VVGGWWLVVGGWYCNVRMKYFLIGTNIICLNENFDLLALHNS
jgi:hypothetical protein